MNSEGKIYTRHFYPKAEEKPVRPRFYCGDMVSLTIKVTIGNATRTTQSMGKIVAIYIDPNSPDGFLYDISHNDLFFRHVHESEL